MSPVPPKSWLAVSLCVAFLILAGGGGLLAKKLASKSASGTSASHDQVVRRAPDQNEEAQLRLSSAGVPELWIATTNESPIKVSRLEPGEGVADNFTWSPNSSLLAFESYNLGGHSPLTTSHVWVVQRNGSGLVRVSLPRPNERLSTYVDGWVNDNTLKIRAELPRSEEDSHYTFVYDKQAVQLISEDKVH
jgi:Tol biopolymer transport system component